MREARGRTVSDLALLLQKLAAAKFEFVLVGAFAAVVHGASVVTRDVDVCCPFTRDNLFLLQDALRDLHPVHRMTPRRLPLEITDANASTFKNLYLQTDIGTLDCLSEIAAVGDYAAVQGRSIEVSFSWGSIRVLDVDALIEAKSALNRLQDKLAIPQLRAISEREKARRDSSAD